MHLLRRSAIGTAVCTAKTRINLRRSPSSSSGKVGTLPAGATVDVYEISNNWYKILYNGKSVWASGSYLQYTTTTSDLSGQTAPVNAVINSPTAEEVTGEIKPETERSYAIYYQGDSRWGFSRSVAKKACVLTGYAVVLKNLELDATPKTVFKANGSKSSISLNNIEDAFGVDAVSALNEDSPYFSSFDGHKTYIKSASTNFVAAVKEALEKHPEGVLLYFTKGSRAMLLLHVK